MSQTTALAQHGPKHEVEKVTQEEFWSFTDARYAVIYAGVGASPKNFHPLLAMYFATQPHTVRLGVVDLSSIHWSSGLSLYVGAALERLQMKPEPNGRPPAGYYLFSKGNPLAFQEGGFDPEQDQDLVNAGLIAGIFTGLVTNDANKAIQAGVGVAKLNAVQRVVTTFDQAMKKHRAG